MSDIDAPRKLQVYAGKQLMGQLRDTNGFWSFEYDEAWLALPNKFSICPDIPLKEGEYLDSGTTCPVQRFFDNLLPEENARLLLVREADVDHEDSFALLTESGIESAGALTLLEECVEFPASDATLLSYGFTR